jgi:gliding motility-associated lipoprotein GldD
MIKLSINSLILIVVLFGCKDDPYLKPIGYPRLNLPEAGYQAWSNNCGFSFRKPICTNIEKLESDSCFFNLSYPSLNAKVFCSYIPVNSKLKEIIDQEYKLREKHNQFSTSVKESVFHSQSKNVHALLFHISGTQAATPLQFFITDSINHFFRGTLYFNNSPNNDSLETAIDFIRTDIDTLVESFEWR